MMKVADITVDPSFYEDWDRAPPTVRDLVTRKLNQSLDAERLLNSFNAHKLRGFETVMWTGHVKQGKEGWRIIFEQAGDTLHLLRLLPHDKRDKHLKSIG